jgi:hypothetical protein
MLKDGERMAKATKLVVEQLYKSSYGNSSSRTKKKNQLYSV